MTSPDLRYQRPPSVALVADPEGTKGIAAEFFVAASVNTIFELLWNTDYFPALYPDIKDFKVLKSTSNSMEVDYRVDAVVKEISYRLLRQSHLEERQAKISWRETGGDLRKVRGAWTILQNTDSETCLVRYETFVDVGRFIPTAIIQKTSAQKMGAIADRVRRQCATMLSIQSAQPAKGRKKDVAAKSSADEKVPSKMTRKAASKKQSS